MPPTISESKTRTLITIEKSDKEKLEAIAREDSRSFNGLVNKILKDFLKNVEEKD